MVSVLLCGEPAAVPSKSTNTFVTMSNQIHFLYPVKPWDTESVMLVRPQWYQSIFEVNLHPVSWPHSTSLPTTWTGFGRDQGISGFPNRTPCDMGMFECLLKRLCTTCTHSQGTMSGAQWSVYRRARCLYTLHWVSHFFWWGMQLKRGFQLEWQDKVVKTQQSFSKP